MKDKTDLLQQSPSLANLPTNDAKLNSGEGEPGSQSNKIKIPEISLPKGGGALKGIDEKFSVNAANGSCSFSIPLPLSPSRGGFQPSLSLNYNSGTGNSIFGLGWDISLSTIRRKTDKKLPLYRDEEETDIFLFSEAEDLVPVADNTGAIIEKTVGNFRIRQYRPRTEGLFALIERIIPGDNRNQSYWKITTRENVTTFFGMTGAARISDPGEAQRIFEWLPELSFDDKGNCMLFTYKKEDKQNVVSVLHEQNRLKDLALFSNSYLKRIAYGNKTPFYPDHIFDPDIIDSVYDGPSSQSLPADFMFELVFDYGEHDQNLHEETKEWSCRSDPFSNYKPGFEIRTYRVCERVLMFHHFSELNAGIKTLVRSLDLGYEQPSYPGIPAEVTYLVEAYQKGYSLKTDGSYHIESLPPLSFEYQKLEWNTTIKQFEKDDLVHAPSGLSGGYQWTDLFNEGISGILTEQAEGWYYKSNLGNSHFSNSKLISPKPSLSGLTNGNVALVDLDANGTKQIVSHSPVLQGFFELTDENDWLPFTPFNEMPNIDLKDANTRLVDLNGDGMADILITGDYAFSWYPSRGKLGFDSPELSPRIYDEEKGPAIIFADGSQSIYMADMCGDGLADIVRIESSGSVCYWPNLGYGRFGAKVNMGSVQFTDPSSFNPSYLQLADVSGTGSTDIIYFGNDKWQVWLNKSGNGFSSPCEIEPFLELAKPVQVDVIDLLGNGTGCIVWSSPLPAHANAPMQYIDLMGGKKPHIMKRYKNGFGKTNSIEYKSSAQYYLEDKKAGEPWVTKLPFPVHCVSKIETTDEVSNLRFTCKYSYHHGYYDQVEKEFRGFGRVEKLDTEEYQYLENSGAANATNIEFYEAPVLTRTWYHTGAFIKNKRILDQFEKEYWYNHPSLAGTVIHEHKLNDAVLPVNLTIDETVEAYRSCKGMILRTEVFAFDKSTVEKIPYAVTTHNCNIRMLQSRLRSPHAVFLVTESENITFTYEREFEDPRIAHKLNLEIDEYGNILKSASVVYGRMVNSTVNAINDLEIIKSISDPVKKQEQIAFIRDGQANEHIVYTETKVTRDSEEKTGNKKLNYYRLPSPWSVKTFEVYGVEKNIAGFYRVGDFQDIISGNFIFKGYHEKFDTAQLTTQLRLIEQVETLFMSYDLEMPLAAGMHGALGLNYESYQLAFTPPLIDALFNVDQQGNLINPRVTDVELTEARYCHIDYDLLDRNWWTRSGKIKYFDSTNNETRSSSQTRYYVPIAYVDPFGNITRIEFPANESFLFIEKTIDALDNTIAVMEFDYRVLVPGKIIDINDNISQVSFNALGLVMGMALMGKGNQADDLSGFNANLEPQEILDFFTDPLTKGRGLLKNATKAMVYDFNSIPARLGTIIRETHVRDMDGILNPESKLQYSFEYTDGLGNSISKKVQAEKGLAKKLQNGVVIEVMSDPRWVGNGRAILNNKGKQVKQYEPYFSTTHFYEDEAALREYGVTPESHYDAMGRLVRTDYPDGAFSKLEFNSWQQKTFDLNDTIKESRWAALRGFMNDIVITNEEALAFTAKLQLFGGNIDKEKEALAKTLIHANTPSIVLLDSLGRSFYTISHNAWQFKNLVDPQPPAAEEFSATKLLIDIEGNTRAVIDGRYNTVMKYDYDMLGHVAHSSSMDAGDRWILDNCMGSATWGWDDKDQRFETDYDVLHRPVTRRLLRNSSAHEFEKIEYGVDKVKNLNGVTVARYDTAGVLRTTEVDFKGAIETSTRQLCTKNDEFPDWNDLSTEVFLTEAKYDALGRISKSVTPHTVNMLPSTNKQVFNEANLLKQISIGLRQSGDQLYVRDIIYNAKAQRIRINFANNSFTKYEYDPDTFMLRRLISCPDTAINEMNFDNDNELIKTAFQFLSYTYDPVGNIVHIEDEAQQTYYFSNSQMKPESDYLYDASYRLIEARGREHIGQSIPTSAYDRNRMFADNIPSAENALRNYTQRYSYDVAGNMLEMVHTVKNIPGSTGWTRSFVYASNSNRLLSTTVGNVTEQYSYDAHGNMQTLPHLPSITWNFKDQVQQIQIEARTDNENADGSSYLYDGSGQRMQKTIVKGNVTEESIYLNGFEIFRRKQSGVMELERESLHVMDDKSRIAIIETLIVQDSATLTDPENLTRYQFTNHLGSACLELNDTGQTISYEEYHPYGTTAYQNQNKNIKAAAKRYRYTGMERDEESGFAYHSARYYLPWLCRWLSADPFRIAGGLNLYSFVNSSPIRKVDNEGLAPGDPPPFPTTRPDFPAKLGTKAHQDILNELVRRLALVGVPAFAETRTQPGGSTPKADSMNQPGEIDLIALEYHYSGMIAGEHTTVLTAHFYELKPIFTARNDSYKDPFHPDITWYRQLQNYLVHDAHNEDPNEIYDSKAGTILERYKWLVELPFAVRIEQGYRWYFPILPLGVNGKPIPGAIEYTYVDIPEPKIPIPIPLDKSNSDKDDKDDSGKGGGGNKTIDALPNKGAANDNEEVAPDGEKIKPAAKAGVAAIATLGVGYLIYRAVRMLPSLAPPLWPTIPVNFAIP